MHITKIPKRNLGAKPEDVLISPTRDGGEFVREDYKYGDDLLDENEKPEQVVNIRS